VRSASRLNPSGGGKVRVSSSRPSIASDVTSRSLASRSQVSHGEP
jgi:hypothetical protein